MFLRRLRKWARKAGIGLSFPGMLLLIGCAPQIKSFSPERGNEGTMVTITGKNFRDVPSENTVKFGEVAATDVSVPDKNKLLVKVPAGATTGLISVTTPKGTGYSNKNFIVVGPAKWTFMVYLDADNNLEDAGIGDYLEMATVGSSPEVNIVVQMDRIGGWSDLYGDWTGTRRFLIQSGDEPSTAPVQDLGEQNMGDPAVLQDFVEWGIDNYPAEHYGLIIWNHGDGWRKMREMMAEKASNARALGDPDCAVARAVASDDTDGDKLYVKEVQTALQAAKQRLEDRYNTAVKLDLVGFDACLMAMVEVSYALRNVANYVVGSEELEPGDGWPYETILQTLVATPSYTPADLAGDICTKYVASYPGVSEITQSAVDIAQLSDLVSKINAFTTKANTRWAELKAARDASIQYHPTWAASCWGVDLRDFADNVLNEVPSGDTASDEIRQAAQELKDAVGNMVVNEHHSPDMAGSHGIAIYFPPTKTAFDNDPDHAAYTEANTFMPVDFVKNTEWDNWLADFFAHNP